MEALGSTRENKVKVPWSGKEKVAGCHAEVESKGVSCDKTTILAYQQLGDIMFTQQK